MQLANILQFQCSLHSMISQLNYNVGFLVLQSYRKLWLLSVLLERSAVNRPSLVRKMIQDLRGQYRDSPTSTQSPLLHENRQYMCQINHKFYLAIGSGSFLFCKEPGSNQGCGRGKGCYGIQASRPRL